MEYYLIVKIGGNNRHYRMPKERAIEYCSLLKEHQDRFIYIQYQDTLSNREYGTNLKIDDISEFSWMIHDEKLDIDGKITYYNMNDIQEEEDIEEEYYEDYKLDIEESHNSEKLKENIDIYNKINSEKLRIEKEEMIAKAAKKLEKRRKK